MASEQQDRAVEGEVPPMWRAPQLQRLTGRDAVAYGSGNAIDGIGSSTPS